MFLEVHKLVFSSWHVFSSLRKLNQKDNFNLLTWFGTAYRFYFWTCQNLEYLWRQYSKLLLLKTKLSKNRAHFSVVAWSRDKNIRDDKSFVISCYFGVRSKYFRDGNLQIWYVFIEWKFIMVDGHHFKYINLWTDRGTRWLTKSIKVESLQLNSKKKHLKQTLQKRSAIVLQFKQLLLAPHSPTSQDRSAKRIRTC